MTSQGYLLQRRIILSDLARAPKNRTGFAGGQLL